MNDKLVSCTEEQALSIIQDSFILMTYLKSHAWRGYFVLIKNVMVEVVQENLFLAEKEILERTRWIMRKLKKGCISFYKGETYFILNKKMTPHQGTYSLSLLHKIGKI